MAVRTDDLAERLVAHLEEPRAAPRLLYKYLAPERIDVLQNAHIRFTQLCGTNDAFEVRRTVNTFFGPRMEALVRESFEGEQLESRCIELLATKLGITREQAEALFNEHRGTAPFKAMMATMTDQLEHLVGTVFPTALGDPEFIMRILTDFASGGAALSLSEDPHIPMMWAHYAANWAGFVLSFDTKDPSLIPSKANGSTFFPIQYRDEPVEEMFDDPIGVFFSKQTGWAYEREWRKIIGPEQADTTLPAEPDDIYLKKFRRSAVERVIVGHRATAAFIDDLRQVLRDYPEAGFFMARPEPSQGKVIEVELER